MSIYKSSFSIDKVKDDIIEDVIDEISGNAKSDLERASTKAALERKIKKSKTITSFDDSIVEVDAEDINRVSGEIYIDLLTTFGSLNMTGEDISRYKTTQEIRLNSMNSKIKELKDRLESCRNSLSDKRLPEYIIERFRSASGFDKKTRLMQKDRYGQYFPSKNFVDYNAKECYLTLPLARQDNSLKYDGKVETGNLNLSFQLGQGFVDLKNESSELENILNGDKKPWSETILSDGPIRTSFMDVKPEHIYIDDKYFYGIEEGAVCELELKFESVNTINEITLDTYCKYPMDIVAIRFKLSDDEDEPLTEIVTPENKDESLKSVFTKGKVTYRFPDILCKNLYILFVQRHYTRETYIYDPKSVYKNSLWFDSKSSKDDKNTKSVFKPRYYNREISNYSWQQVNEKVVTSSEDLVKILIGDESKIRKVTKYEYNYGFYNIGCFNSHYDRTGFYVSKPIQLLSNVKKIELETDELHQLDSNGNMVTDIEYYITGAKNPTTSEWIPILPKNKKVIESETLFIQGGTRAYFRFEAEEVYTIMKNGVPIPENSPEYYLEKNNITGKYWCVMIFNYDYDAVYSVKYMPVDGSEVIDLSKKNTTSVESFESKGESSIVLENNPHVDSTDNYCSILLTDLNEVGDGQNINAVNVTEVTNPSESYKNFDYKTSQIQYYILKNVIYFNKPIKSGQMIDVTYRHLITNIRTKAILRRNTFKDGWLTPALKEIKYNVETF